jgi:hypothetical protein
MIRSQLPGEKPGLFVRAATEWGFSIVQRLKSAGGNGSGKGSCVETGSNPCPLGYGGTMQCLAFGG